MNINFSPFPQLSTERLLLRSLQDTDAGEIFALRSDDNNNKYLDRPKANTIEDAQEFIQKIVNGISNNESIYWVISFKNETTLAGTICLWNFDTVKEVAEIGYELLPGYKGKGIMQEAMQKVIAFCFETMQLQSIEACVHKDNIASVKLLEKNNFIYTKSENSDMIIYALCKKVSR
jgi:[ribosomal protein S5]-alanine N-acetyltransferase